jgi:hypothetical protein
MNYIFLFVLFLNTSSLLSASLNENEKANESSMTGTIKKDDGNVQSDNNDFIDDEDDGNKVVSKEEKLQHFLKENLELFEYDSKNTDQRVVRKRQSRRTDKNLRKAKNCMVHKKLCLFIG